MIPFQRWTLLSDMPALAVGLCVSSEEWLQWHLPRHSYLVLLLTGKIPAHYGVTVRPRYRVFLTGFPDKNAIGTYEVLLTFFPRKKATQRRAMISFQRWTLLSDMPALAVGLCVSSEEWLQWHLPRHSYLVLLLTGKIPAHYGVTVREPFLYIYILQLFTFI